ncbi:MAG TPA: hypothetical protein VMW77_06005 [Methanoregula sp.]|nr:hypothetical protein [Methanoregula sp.]
MGDTVIFLFIITCPARQGMTCIGEENSVRILRGAIPLIFECRSGRHIGKRIFLNRDIVAITGRY